MNINKIENIVLDAISEATHIEKEDLDYYESFEDYGIESAMMINIIRVMEKSLGELPKTLFFEYNNIRELLQHLNKKIGQEEIPNPIFKNDNIITDSSLEEPVYIMSNEEEIKEENFDLSDEVEDFEETTVEDLTIDFDHLMRGNFEKNEIINSNDIAIIGMSGKFPMADNLDEFWENLVESKDCIEEIPSRLWDWKKNWNQEKGIRGKTYSKWGGFISDTDKFDPLFFNISNLEAGMLDPQERKFLEVVYHTLENSGYTKRALSDLSVGVYVGVMWGQYQLYGTNNADAQSSYASIANRVSYFFDFTGPCIALDTMCSSSLTSLHLACESIKSGECDVAIAGGVNLTVHPNKYIYLSKTGFAASDGRCRSFGDGGDGYVPGDGVGAFLLKPLNKAIKDKDNIWGVIKSTSINHGGKSKGFTAPNPRLQTKLIKKGLEKASISPNSLSYLELHGTGTALGDPIELKALANAFNELGVPNHKIPIGSVKSNIGHLESAAGFASIAKVLLQMRNEKLVPSINSDVLNPNINFEEVPFYVQRDLKDWNNTQKFSSVSSFGAGGSNAFVVLEEYKEAKDKKNKTIKPYFILLSAKTKEQLACKVKDLYTYLITKHSLDKHSKEIDNEIGILYNDLLENVIAEKELITLDDKLSILDINLNGDELKSFFEEELSVLNNNCITLRDLLNIAEKHLLDKLLDLDHESLLSSISYTLQVGRENMRFRTFFKVYSLADLYKQLDAIIADEETYPIYSNKDKNLINDELISKNDFIRRLVETKDIKRLVELWAQGLNIEFSPLYADHSVKKISLPEYPFAKEKCWIEEVNNESNLSAIANESYLNTDSLINFLYRFGINQNIDFEYIDLKSIFDHIEEVKTIKDEGTIKFKFNDLVLAKARVLEESRLTGEEVNIAKYYTNTKIGDIDEVEQIKENVNEKLIVAKTTFSNEFVKQILEEEFGDENLLNMQSFSLDLPIKYIYIINNDTLKKVTYFSAEKEVSFIFQKITEVKLEGNMYLPSWKEFEPAITSNNHEKVYIFDSSISQFMSNLTEKDSYFIELGETEESSSEQYIKISYDKIDDLKKYLHVLENREIFYLGVQSMLFSMNVEFDNVYSNLIIPFWKVLKALNEAKKEFKIHLITNNSWKILDGDKINPISSLLIGIGKSASKEFKKISLNTIDIDMYNDGLDLNKLNCMIDTDLIDIAIRNDTFYHRTFDEVYNISGNGVMLNDIKTIVMIGGSGNVGRKITQYILSRNKVNVIWIGRREVESTIKTQLDKYKNLLHYYQANVNDFNQLMKVFGSITDKYGEIDMVMNLAMDFSIDRLNNINQNYIIDKLIAKVNGNINLLEIANKYNISNLILFSSGEAFTCNIGWGIYASSCIFTDSLKDYINTNTNINCISINWGFWETDDKNLNEQFKFKGIYPLDTQKGGQAFEKILSSNYSQILTLDVSDLVKDKMGIVNSNIIKTYENLKLDYDIINKEIRSYQDIESVAIKLKKVFAKVLKIDEEKISIDEDLASYGVDSLLITEIHKAIKELFGDIPASVILEEPTINDIAKYIMNNSLNGELIEEVELNSIESYLRNYGEKFKNEELTLKKSISLSKIVKTSDEKFVHFSMNINDKNVEVMMYGKGRPILFLPAIGLTASSFVKQFISLSDKYKVIVIHAPGYGLSGVVSNAKTAQVGDIIVESLENLNLKDSITIVASCFGSIVGTYISYKHSSMISSLVLIGGFYDGSDLPPIDSKKIGIDELNNMTLEISRSIAKDFDNLKLLDNINESLINDSKEVLLNSRCSNALVAIRYLNEMINLNTISWLKELDIPVLCIYGDNDSIIKPERSKVIQENTKYSSIYEIKNSGHYPYLTNEHEFNDVLLGFIEEV
ncbi:alpha/beta fold hydrolase [Paraclostridium bifermentans]|uniref:alpha/beta fold hydrolase n=1 Tax=Paraclostridium bifermentans TaxID=1490 RepID=UPI0029149974|nr:alpha/beta fold hydrolase [Paraclostridium bifermentans]MDU3338023.1 alpha/beta fold hydrolase [Paraclostridium bifermentans]